MGDYDEAGLSESHTAQPHVPPALPRDATAFESNTMTQKPPHMVVLLMDGMSGFPRPGRGWAAVVADHLTFDFGWMVLTSG